MKEVIIKNHGIRKEIICDGVSMNLKDVVTADIHIDAEGIKLSVNKMDIIEQTYEAEIPVIPKLPKFGALIPGTIDVTQIDSDKECIVPIDYSNGFSRFNKINGDK